MGAQAGREPDRDASGGVLPAHERDGLGCAAAVADLPFEAGAFEGVPVRDRAGVPAGAGHPDALERARGTSQLDDAAEAAGRAAACDGGVPPAGRADAARA